MTGRKFIFYGLLGLSVLVLSYCQGCKLDKKREQRNMERGLDNALEDPPPRYRVKLLLVDVREGTQEEQFKAQKSLIEDFGRYAYPWIVTALGDKQPTEVEERLTEIAVAILLKDAGSVHESFRKQAVDDLVSIDKRFGILDELLLRLETADQTLSNSVFKVLEERKYISGDWSWPDQAWEELSARFAGEVDILKRYVVYKLSDLPRFDARTMNWDDYDRKHAFTVLSELVLSEEYEDLAHLFVGMLDAYAPRIRREAARVLGHLNHGDAANKLTEMLAEDPSDRVRASAAEALGRMKAEDEAATMLVVLLRKGELLGSNVCWALGEMKSLKAVGALISQIENPPAMLALGKIGNELAVKPLTRMLQESNDIRKKTAAARALGAFKSEAVLQDLKRALSSEISREVQSELIFSIFRIDPKPHEAAVRDRLAEYNPEIRLRAMTLLLSRGMIRNISLIKVMELIENIPTAQRMSYWEKLEESYSYIPPYDPFALNYKREKQITEINKWFNDNRSRFFYDEATEKIRIRN